MQNPFWRFLAVAACTTVSILMLAAALHLIPRLGTWGRRLVDRLCRAPGLDGLIMYFIVLPLVMGPAFAGWAGLAGAVTGQVLSLLIWVRVHELANPQAVGGPRIVKSLNRIVGWWRNHAALWVTMLVAPGFVLVRVVEILFYPPVRRLVGLPRYKHGDWVNVSRHKFKGLVGHDLIWCLYCDWMTGVWSLGSEMLRNVESFWCPIRFQDGKKCENCAIDFPDVGDGWVSAEGDIAQVALTIDSMHGNGDHSWFGKRVQVSLNGRPIANSGDELSPSDDMTTKAARIGHD